MAGVCTRDAFDSCQIVDRWAENGVPKVRANSGLKWSQRYPWGFADKILNLWLQSRTATVDLMLPGLETPDWSDAKLEGVTAFLEWASRVSTSH